MTDLVPVSHSTHVLRRVASSHSFSPGQYIPVVSGDAQPYQGPYEAMPSWSDQTFATADRYMTDDFSVDSILELEVANDAGGLTLTI